MVGIDDFVSGLKAIPDFHPRQVYEYIKAHPVEPQTLKPYLLFSRASYTRNLIFKNEMFELLALCWEVGQASRIHNHRDQQCWMLVPMGKLKNQNYRVVARDPKTMSCRLEPSREFLITPAAPAEVDQNEPVHQVLNLPEWNERAVSLHIYSRPFNSCEVYYLDKGSYCDVPLHYTSEYGKQVEGEPGERPE
jgi:cysteine dioxygenase